MHFSLLFYGNRTVNPEDFVFSSVNEDWNPLVVSLSGAGPLLANDASYIDFRYVFSPNENANPFTPFDTLLGKVSSNLTMSGRNALVFLRLSLLSSDILSTFRPLRGEDAGRFSFSLVLSLVNNALALGQQFSIPVFFHAYEKNVRKENKVSGEQETLIAPALGRRTLDLLLPRFHFVAYAMWHEGRQVLVFKTKTGRVLVKDPLGRLAVEEADLGALVEKIERIIMEKGNVHHSKHA